MNKQLFIFLSVIVISVSGYGQTTFQQAFQRNTAMGYAGQQTSDGGYIMSGLTTVTTTDYDYLVVKTNATGDTLWTKTYGGIGDDESYAMQQTLDGGYIFAGIDSSSGLGNYNIYLVKTNANGDTLWTKSYGGSSDDFAQAIQQTTDKGYIIAGYTGSFGAGNGDVYLLKTDSMGTLTWSKTYGGLQGDLAYAVKQTTDGGYVIAGATSSFGVTTNGEYNDVYLLKTDATGTLTWSKTYGRGGYDAGYGVVQTNDGGYAITGYTNVDSSNTAVSQVYLIKTDANGDTLFTKSFSGTNYDQGNAIIQAADSGLVISGSSYSFGNGGSDVYLIKTNKTGGLVFNSTFGGSGNDWAYSVGQTSDSGFVLSGYTGSYSLDSNSFYMVKTDKMGNSNNCNQTSPTPTVQTGVAMVNTPTTTVGTPPTMTANNTHTSIKSGVSIANACPNATGIKKLSAASQFMVYPNPSNGNITFKTNNLIDNTQLTIYNQLGQVVLKKQLTNQLTDINLDVNSGVYQVRILSGGELMYQSKLIKE